MLTSRKGSFAVAGAGGLLTWCLAWGFGTGLNTVEKREENTLRGEVNAALDPAARVHQRITTGALDQISEKVDGRTQTFSPRAKKEVADHNADVDRYNYVSAQHFDNGDLKEGSESIYRAKEAAIVALTGDIPNGRLARVHIGRALHAIQDFYSHSTWLFYHTSIELAPLGDMPTHPSLLNSNHIVCDASGSNPTISSLTSGVYDEDTFLFITQIGTTLSFVKQFVGVESLGNGRCIHGLPVAGSAGINRDLVGRDGFLDAYAAAQAASLDFVRSKIIGDARVRNNVDALCALLDVSPLECKTEQIEILIFTAPPQTPPLGGFASSSTSSGPATEQSIPLDLGTVFRTDRNVRMCRIGKRWIPKTITADRPRGTAGGCPSLVGGHEFTSVKLDEDGTLTGHFKHYERYAGVCGVGTTTAAISRSSDSKIEYRINLKDGAGWGHQSLNSSESIDGQTSSQSVDRQGSWGAGKVFFNYASGGTVSHRPGDEIPEECKDSKTEVTLP